MATNRDERNKTGPVDKGTGAAAINKRRTSKNDEGNKTGPVEPVSGSRGSRRRDTSTATRRVRRAAFGGGATQKPKPALKPAQRAKIQARHAARTEEEKKAHFTKIRQARKAGNNARSRPISKKLPAPKEGNQVPVSSTVPSPQPKPPTGNTNRYIFSRPDPRPSDRGNTSPSTNRRRVSSPGRRMARRQAFSR